MFKIEFIFSGHDSSYFLREACMELEKEFQNELLFHFSDTYELDEGGEMLQKCLEKCAEADFIFIAIHGGVTLFKSFDKIFTSNIGKKKFFVYSGIEEENILLLKDSGISNYEYEEILKYHFMGGQYNNINMILYIASTFGKVNYHYKEAVSPPWEGIYHPDKVIEDYRKYIHDLKKSGKPIIGILFFSKYIHEDNVRHIDEIITRIEKYGGKSLAIYTSSAPNPSVGCKGLQWTIDNLLMEEGLPVVDTLINNMGYAQSVLSNPGDGTTLVDESIFEQIGVPVIQAMSVFYSLDGWKKAIRGVDSMSLASSVYHPEFDGQIIGAPIAYIDNQKERAGNRMVFMPIKERADKVCRLAMNWALLRKKPQSEKKAAIIFHNMPPRNDRIGCAFGLDTPKSVWNMVESLKREGVYTEYDFENGDDIINRIIAGVSNDIRFLPTEQLLEKSIDIIKGDEYREWFSHLEGSVQKKMQSDWGTPPGEFMVHDDQLPIPGILNGNVFIGLQPARGFEEKADEVYHSTDIVPPHQYIAFYKWIKHVFKADVIVHVGTHGTLEWLPGKEIGLSNECYPDIAIDDIPHLYPYIIDVPGEGIQVKRRSYGVLLDHMIPSLVNSGVYDEMGEMDELIKQYYQAVQGDEGKLQDIQQNIINLALKNNFDQDLNIDAKIMEEDFSFFINKLHPWIEEIKNSLIKDGLHIFGESPVEERLTNLMSALLRLPNGEVPALPEALCESLGLDYQYLKENPEYIDGSGVSNYMKLDYIEEKSREIMGLLLEIDFNKEVIGKIVQTIQGLPFSSSNSIISKSFDLQKPSSTKLTKVLNFTCEILNPKLNRITDEIKYFIEGINGRFVPPGESGCPIRGRASILPTGRNFYSIDPGTVPTRAAWEVGMRLGDSLIERFLNDEGKYPENIVMVVYSGETMKTCGDDIAEALYLMGVKPKWLENTDRVVGLEVIPQEVLGRPRIDVTLRITGLFRDTFPNIIELAEDAVNLAASQEEDESVNYLRRNILKDMDKLKGEGLTEESALQQAGMRIFGCPPGTYGAGVDILINSKNWKDTNDLGDVYTTWGGYAYGKKIHGIKVKSAFAARLAAADATVKNESSMEIDMLESDDFYNYHGGLIAAVTTYSGKKPKSYSGDSSDPSRTKIRDVNEETARVMRARIMNPKWFEGLKRHGYKGAQEVAAMVDIVFGWDATSEVAEDWMYDKIAEDYLFDDEKKQWIQDVNPWAIHSMTERLLEANQRNMWNASEDTLEKLKEIYLDIEGNIEDVL